MKHEFCIIGEELMATSW